METLVSQETNHFTDPDKTIGGLRAKAAAKLIAAAADIALIIDTEGIVRDAAFSSSELAEATGGSWLGQAWADTVHRDSRDKIKEMLEDARGKELPRWRQVNHPLIRGGDVPISYSTVQLEDGGPIVAVGRDLRGLIALQRRLLDAQQSMEREYARLRQSETRYRLLFDIATEPVIIVGANEQSVVEANPAASRLLGIEAGRLVGRPFFELFDSASRSALYGLFGAVQAGGRGDEISASLPKNMRQLSVSASLFRQGTAAHFLVRLSPLEMETAVSSNEKRNSKLFKVIEGMPDGFVVIGMDRTILDMNAAFIDLAQCGSREQVRGEPLDRWLGRPGIDMDILFSNLREFGSVSCFSSIMRGEYGVVENVEISAVAVSSADPPCFGFIIRNVGARLTSDGGTRRGLPRSVEQLTELIGRVPLKDIVRETTDVIERLCIEAALELTGDNRASAAQMLGLSRQSLYSKLRRYGLGDLGPEEGAAD